MLRVLVVGYGSVGKRYVENLLKYSNIQVMICTKRKDLNSEIIKKCEDDWCNVLTDDYTGWIKIKNVWGYTK